MSGSSDMTGALIARVMRGDLAVATISPEGSATPGVATGLVVLSGVFNPLHVGHERMLAAACAMTGRPGALEISVLNVEKPELEQDELLARLPPLRGRYTVLLSRARTFVEKARIMPDTRFVIGYDTAVRLFDDRFYPPYDPADDPENTGSASLAALAEVRRHGCGFIVAGRVHGAGQSRAEIGEPAAASRGATVDHARRDSTFGTLRDIAIPPGYEDLLAELPESDFREDISSTEIRARRGATS